MIHVSHHGTFEAAQRQAASLAVQYTREADDCIRRYGRQNVAHEILVRRTRFGMWTVRSQHRMGFGLYA